MTKKIFIASPYTHGDKKDNLDAQHLAFHALMEMGCHPFAPLFSHYHDLEYPKSYAHYMRWTCEWVLVCDAILRLPGYSKGADTEVSKAESYGIEILNSAWHTAKYMMINVFDPDNESEKYAKNFNNHMIALLNLFY